MLRRAGLVVRTRPGEETEFPEAVAEVDVAESKQLRRGGKILIAPEECAPEERFLHSVQGAIQIGFFSRENAAEKGLNGSRFVMNDSGKTQRPLPVEVESFREKVPEFPHIVVIGKSGELGHDLGRDGGRMAVRHRDQKIVGVRSDVFAAVPERLDDELFVTPEIHVEGFVDWTCRSEVLPLCRKRKYHAHAPFAAHRDLIMLDQKPGNPALREETEFVDIPDEQRPAPRQQRNRTTQNSLLLFPVLLKEDHPQLPLGSPGGDLYKWKPSVSRSEVVNLLCEEPLACSCFAGDHEVFPLTGQNPHHVPHGVRGGTGTQDRFGGVLEGVDTLPGGSFHTVRDPEVLQETGTATGATGVNGKSPTGVRAER
jgi:hypothetical protein